VTVNSRDEHDVPPTTHTFEEVASTPKATIRSDVVLHPERHYDIYASTVAGDPPQPSASQLIELEPVAGEQQQQQQPAGGALGRLFGRIRRDG
jgi:hypothetical protein